MFGAPAQFRTPLARPQSHRNHAAHVDAALVHRGVMPLAARSDARGEMEAVS